MLYTTGETRGELGWFVRETGSYGLTWALKNSSKFLMLTILNRPLTVSSPVPGVLKQLRSFSLVSGLVTSASTSWAMRPGPFLILPPT
ncbi:hypothetical protein ZWY2020_012347 [Hordeum vulgare]|nr:hypothetical protein ZWY2020_012347 [Hordeum vulgare]